MNSLGKAGRTLRSERALTHRDRVIVIHVQMVACHALVALRHSPPIASSATSLQCALYHYLTGTASVAKHITTLATVMLPGYHGEPRRTTRAMLHQAFVLPLQALLEPHKQLLVLVHTTRLVDLRLHFMVQLLRALTTTHHLSLLTFQVSRYGSRWVEARSR